MYELEVVLVQANNADGAPYRYFEEVANEDIALTTAVCLVRRMSSSGAQPHVVRTGPQGKHLAYTDVTGIVGYANIVPSQCDCGAENHPSASDGGGYVHSESCPLY